MGYRDLAPLVNGSNMDFDVINVLADNDEFLKNAMPNIVSKVQGSPMKTNLYRNDSVGSGDRDMSVQSGVITIASLKGAKNIAVSLPIPCEGGWYPILTSVRHSSGVPFDSTVTASNSKTFWVTITPRAAKVTYTNVYLNWIAVLAHA